MFAEHLAKLARALDARKPPYMLIGFQAVLVSENFEALLSRGNG